MVSVLEAALSMAGNETCVLKAAPDIGLVAGELATLLFASLAGLMGKAQSAGLVRADLEPDDLPRLVLMLISTTHLSDRSHEDWRRYLALILDAFRPIAASPLPPASPLTGFP